MVFRALKITSTKKCIKTVFKTRSGADLHYISPHSVGHQLDHHTSMLVHCVVTFSTTFVDSHCTYSSADGQVGSTPVWYPHILTAHIWLGASQFKVGLTKWTALTEWAMYLHQPRLPPCTCNSLAIDGKSVDFKSDFMPSPSDTVSKRIMISGCPSTAFVHSFFRTNLVTTISHAWLAQSGWNVKGISNNPYWRRG